jgi:CTP synthase (UTP-ammonia lyase)
MRYVAVLGEFTPTFKPHVATNAAIRHTCAALGLSVEAEWVSTRDISQSLLSRYSGIWVAPGSPYKNLERTLWASEHARTIGSLASGRAVGFSIWCLSMLAMFCTSTTRSTRNTIHTHQRCSSRSSPVRWRGVR